MKYIYMLSLFAVLAFTLSGCSSTTATKNSKSSANEPNWGVQAKATGCMPHDGLPDSACTPGAIFPTVTKSQICTPGYASSVRNVSTSLKNQVYTEYGIKKRIPGQFEIDHLVSLQLGGSNDIANLWPEAASPKPGFHEKDKVESYLHDQICSGAISMKQAQIEIATNWLAVYKTMPKNSNSSGSGEGSP